MKLSEHTQNTIIYVVVTIVYLAVWRLVSFEVAVICGISSITTDLLVKE